MVSHTLLVEFSAVFDEKPQPLEKYLQGMSQKTVLDITTFLLGFATGNSKFDSHYELLSMFFRKENNDFANEVNTKLNALQAKYKTPIKIINPATALQIFEFAFDHLDDQEIQTPAEIEINIFKAILAQNEVNTQLQEKAGDSTQHLPMPGMLFMLTLSQNFPFFDLLNYDLREVFATQTIKSIFLFEFLSEHPDTGPLLTAYLAAFNLTEWKDFLKGVMPLMIATLKKDREAYTDIVVSPGPDFDESTAFIEKLILKDEEPLQDYDFRKIRGNPFFKVEEGVYRVIYDLFVVELIHKGLYFKLSEINNGLPQEDMIKNFRSFYTDEFSERYLLYRLLASIYQKRYVKFTGSEMKAEGYDAEPDYYIRNGRKVFLFESKDILINAEVKTTYDFGLHEPEFRKKLYYEDKTGKGGVVKRANKAVLQLTHNIVRLLDKKFSFDQNYKANHLVIYPIVILYDRMYQVPGLNYLVNEWYQAELLNLQAQGWPIENLQPITIIDIDCLILHQDVLRNRNIVLEEVIDAYHHFVKINSKKAFQDLDDARQYYQDKTISFPYFMTNYVIGKKLYQFPQMLQAKGYSLFQ